jgi:lipid A 4'-phosphatase
MIDTFNTAYSYMRKKIVFQWILPLALLVAFAPFSTWIDLKISSFFYLGHRTFPSSPLLDFFFFYGEKSSFFVSAIVLTLFFCSYFIKKWISLRLPSLFIGLAILLGPGFIVNVGMKQVWGRPRPLQIVEFGGKTSFRPFWAPRGCLRPNFEYRSFPSGHTAIGFSYLTLVFLGRRYQNRTLLITGISLTLFWGVGLMCARIIQGGHFFSDVVVSALLMFWLVKGLDFALYGNHRWSIQMRKDLLGLQDQLLPV